MTTPTATAKATATRTRKPATRAEDATDAQTLQAEEATKTMLQQHNAPKQTETATAQPAQATAPRKPRATKAAPAPEPTPAPEPKAKTAADYRKEIDLAIIAAAGDLVKANVPADLREHVAKLIANQLHHLVTPANGWPSEILPKPDRSEWR